MKFSLGLFCTVDTPHVGKRIQLLQDATEMEISCVSADNLEPKKHTLLFLVRPEYTAPLRYFENLLLISTDNQSQNQNSYLISGDFKPPESDLFIGLCNFEWQRIYSNDQKVSEIICKKLFI
jgi:hypothetical protein